MEYQSLGRHQRPKAAKLKQALLVMLLLVVCAWLTYQIKHSRNETQSYGGQNARYRTRRFGRKVTPSRLDETTLSDLGNVGQVKESGDDRDAALNGAMEYKAEEEYGHIDEKFRENEVQRQPQVSLLPNIKYNDSSKEISVKVYIESRRRESHNKGQSNELYPKIPFISDSQSDSKETEVELREPPNDVQIIKNAELDILVKEKDKDEDPGIRKKERGRQENVVEIATNTGMTERTDGVHSFRDENGIPPDVSEAELLVGLADILHEENTSKFIEGSRLFEENNDVKMNVEGSTDDMAADKEINPGSITDVHISSINRNSEIGEGDCSVSPSCKQVFSDTSYNYKKIEKTVEVTSS